MDTLDPSSSIEWMIWSCFHPLDDEQLIDIARIQVGLLTERLAVVTSNSKSATTQLQRWPKSGFDPAYGARPLKRAIQKRLENPLASEILSGRYQSGDVIRVEMKGKDVVFIQQVELPSQAA